jgi:hypothetical protein
MHWGTSPTTSFQLLSSATATEAKPRKATGRKRMVVFKDRIYVDQNIKTEALEVANLKTRRERKKEREIKNRLRLKAGLYRVTFA